MQINALTGCVIYIKKKYLMNENNELKKSINLKNKKKNQSRKKLLNINMKTISKKCLYYKILRNIFI